MHHFRSETDLITGLSSYMLDDTFEFRGQEYELRVSVSATGQLTGDIYTVETHGGRQCRCAVTARRPNRTRTARAEEILWAWGCTWPSDFNALRTELLRRTRTVETKAERAALIAEFRREAAKLPVALKAVDEPKKYGLTDDERAMVDRLRWQHGSDPLPGEEDEDVPF